MCAVFHIWRQLSEVELIETLIWHRHTYICVILMEDFCMKAAGIQTFLQKNTWENMKHESPSQLPLQCLFFEMKLNVCRRSVGLILCFILLTFTPEHIADGEKSSSCSADFLQTPSQSFWSFWKIKSNMFSHNHSLWGWKITERLAGSECCGLTGSVCWILDHHQKLTLLGWSKLRSQDSVKLNKINVNMAWEKLRVGTREGWADFIITQVNNGLIICFAMKIYLSDQNESICSEKAGKNCL